MIPGGRTPIVPSSELQTIGFAAVIFPNVFTYAYAKLATARQEIRVRSGRDLRFLFASHTSKALIIPGL
jgi:2-methylisocitrate lyase-like PEP mutase family enzyme